MIEILRAIADDVSKAIKQMPLSEAAKEIGMGADGTPSSEIDNVSENIVLGYLREHNVPLNILSEEIGFVDNGAKETLVLDPIDGSTNSTIGIPMYTISMAIGRRALSDVHTAYVRNLVTGDEYTAEKGKGAFCNGVRIHSKVRFDPKKSRMMIYLGRGASPRSYSLAKRIKSTREMGCSSLEMILVATGAVDGYLMDSETYERAIRIVDIAASVLILREAGGEVYTMDGTIFDMPFDLEHRSNFLAAANTKVYDYVMDGNSLLSADRGKIRYGICANMTIPASVSVATRVIKALKDEEYIIEKQLAAAMGKEGEPIEDMDVDIMITIGGDGTILRVLQSTDAAIIGINAGGVGFLTEIRLENIEEGIARLIKGNYTIQKRIRIMVSQNGKVLGEALNDTVMHSDSVAKIRQFRVYVNDSLTTDVRADGILFATPTGSTSYAMSLGGPIMDPGVDAWLMIPMAAFKFSSRQMIIPASKKVTIEAVLDKGCLLVIDGQKEYHLDGGSSIELTRSPRSSSFIVFDTDFYSRVRSKLVNSL